MPLVRFSNGGSKLSATFTESRYRDSNQTACVIRTVALSDGRGNYQSIPYTNSSYAQEFGFDGYVLINTKTGSAAWPTYIKTPIACDVYKNGTYLGTTTPNTQFSIDYDFLHASNYVPVVVVAVPV